MGILSGISAVTGALGGGGLGLIGDVASAGFSARQARKQMEFQERMSNTAYQRAAADLEAAGLNRILALGSPASTPGGAMGQVPSFGSAMSQGATAGYGLAASAQQIQQSEAQIKSLIANSRLANTKAGTELAKSEAIKAIAPIIAQAGRDFKQLSDWIRDPARMGEWRDILRTEGSDVLKALDVLLGDIYGSRYKGSTIRETIIEAEGRINLGPGRIK